MNNKEMLGEIHESVLQVYKPNFHYLNSEGLVYDKDTRLVQGNFSFKEDTYLINSRTDCLNNTEAIFLANQIMYICVYSCLFLEDRWKKLLTSFDQENIDISQNIGNTITYLVIGSNNFRFREPLFASAQNPEAQCQCKISSVKQISSGVRFDLTGHMGSNKEFEFDMQAFIINQDIHGGLT